MPPDRDFTRAGTVSRQSAFRERPCRIRPVRYILTVIFASVTISQLLGCAAIQTYPGERLSRDKVAVIRNEAGRTAPSVYVEIVAIDEKKVEYDDRSRGLAILPGRHKISVLVSGYKGVLFTHGLTGQTEITELTLNAIAGETYVLRSGTDESRRGANEARCYLFFVTFSISPGGTPLLAVAEIDHGP